MYVHSTPDTHSLTLSCQWRTVEISVIHRRLLVSVSQLRRNFVYGSPYIEGHPRWHHRYSFKSRLFGGNSFTACSHAANNELATRECMDGYCHSLDGAILFSETDSNKLWFISRMKFVLFIDLFCISKWSRFWPTSGTCIRSLNRWHAHLKRGLNYKHLK